MSEMRVVYITSRRAAPSVVDVLRRHGVHASVLGTADPVMEYVSRWTLKVHVGVPAEEYDTAVGVLQAWERERRPAVAGATKQFRRTFVASLAVTALAGVVLRLSYDNWSDPPWGALFLVWLIALMGIGVLQRWKCGR